MKRRSAGYGHRCPKVSDSSIAERPDGELCEASQASNWLAQRQGFQPIVGLALLLGAFAPPVATPVGIGARFHPPPASRCASSESGRRAQVHVELFARRRVVLIPAGIGVARDCALRTTAPTGVVEFVARMNPTLGDFFSVWGQPLSHSRLAGFVGRVQAYVGGRPWRGDVRDVPLRPQGQITLVVGGLVQPHAFFLFPTAGA